MTNVEDPPRISLDGERQDQKKGYGISTKPTPGRADSQSISMVRRTARKGENRRRGQDVDPYATEGV